MLTSFLVNAPQCYRTSCSISLRNARSYSTKSPLPQNDTDATIRTKPLEAATARTHQPNPLTMKTSIRSLMRHVPSSVTVITVHATRSDHDTVLPVGSAISSFSTVTLDPPHISFNIKTPSRTLSAIREAAGRFRVHFLDNSSEAAKLAQNFTKGNSNETLKDRARIFSFEIHDAERTRFAPPRIVSNAVVASMECQLLQEASVADHVVVIARVNGLECTGELRPTLLYHEGKYKSYDGTLLLHP